MTAIPYIPLYVADYLADTSHLSTIEHGAYLLLIMNYWQRGKPLPSGDLQLSRIARLSPDEWAQVRPSLSEFFNDDGETWSHNRIEVELAKVHEKSVKASNAGKASAERRSNKRSTDVQRTLNHTDTDTDTDKKDTLVVSDDKTSDESDFQELWKVYPQRLGDRGKKIAVKSYRAARKRASHAQIMKGVKAYADFCVSEQKINTPYVKLAATWLNQDGWQEDYISSDPKLAKAEAARRAIELHNATSTKDKPQWD